MKTSLILCLIFSISIFSRVSAQSDTLIKAGSPEIGKWEIADTSSKGAPFIEDFPHKIVELKAGTESSLIGLYYDEELGLAGPSYFIAVKKGNEITGKLEDSLAPMLIGESIHFSYKYHKKTDQLECIINGTSYFFKRFDR